MNDRSMFELSFRHTFFRLFEKKSFVDKHQFDIYH